MQFDRPAPPGDRFVNEANVGNLLVIEVLSTEYGVQTENGLADCIRANVHVIQPPGTVAAEYLGTLMFGKVLFSRLSQSVGRTVLGVLTGQPGVKIQGKNVPYDLDDPTDAMEQAAVRAMMSRPQQAPQQQPAQAWGQQPATQAPAGWGAPSQQQGPPPGWGQQPAQQPQAPAAGWGSPPPQQGPPQPGGWQQPPAQQQIPQQQPERPPWETDQPAGPPPWGGQQ